MNAESAVAISWIGTTVVEFGRPAVVMDTECVEDSVTLTGTGSWTGTQYLVPCKFIQSSCVLASGCGAVVADAGLTVTEFISNGNLK